ncbi:hypothetical protein OG440_40220 (plasmid) [Streptomyces sp. NBC_00637]|uniref:hypothetical protein n=1 Tax=Streptomyces sp. NBC_00637 TaxID=2903667 RepID=UPI00324A28B5
MEDLLAARADVVDLLRASGWEPNTVGVPAENGVIFFVTNDWDGNAYIEPADRSYTIPVPPEVPTDVAVALCEAVAAGYASQRES